MTAMPNARWSVSQQWFVTLLDQLLAAHTTGPQSVVDLGGGSGTIAAHIAEQGHTVTVIDPSPDQLANTARRAREMGLTDRLDTKQGDTNTLPELVAPGSVDIVLCHHVLYGVPDRNRTMANVAAVLRPGGLASFLVRQRYQRMMRHALDGDLDAVRAVLDDPTWVGRSELTTLLTGAGFTVLDENGVGAISDMVRADVASADLLELEERVARHPEWFDAAASIHMLARRRND